MKAKCPHCGHDFEVKPKRRSRMRPVPVNSTMASWFATFVAVHERTGDYVHSVDVAKARPNDVGANVGSWQRLKYWGLCEPKVNEDTKKKTSGLWRPTEKGKQWVRGELRIPHKAFVKNDTAQKFDSSKEVSISEAMLIPFDYATYVAELKAARD